MARPGGQLVPARVGMGCEVAVIPVVTAAQYAANKEVGPILNFNNILPDTPDNIGILESITLKFKGSIQNTQFILFLFNTSPPNGTYADDTTPTWNAADMQYCIGAYSLSASNSLSTGTMSIYNLDNIGKQINGLSQNLYGVLISVAQMANALASISDAEIDLGMMW